jgi:hypothetical protein
MDPGGERDRASCASERVYRALLRAYPQEVRRRYAEEMVGYFGELCREERRSGGHMGVALLWARTLPDLLFTALEERSTLFRRNAYLPVDPGMVARWGALCALVGGTLGVAYNLYYPISYSLRVAINVLTGDGLTGAYYVHDPFAMFFTLSLHLGALSLSSLGLFGLYGAVVARSGRPGLLAGAGAAFSSVSAVLWLATSGYSAVGQLATGSAFFAPFEWVRNTGSFVVPLAMLSWFVGFLLLGIAAARQPLPVRLRVLPLALFALIVSSFLLGEGYYWVAPFGMTRALLIWFVGLLLVGVATARQPLPVRLRVLPLALFALIMPSYWLGGYLGAQFESSLTPIEPSVMATIVVRVAANLPFVGIALLGWVLLKGHDAADEPLAVSGGLAESAGAAHGMARSASRAAGGAWGAPSGASDVKAAREKELLEAIRRHGGITAAEAALETPLSVEEADRMLSELAVGGHLEVRVDGARITYSLWEGQG